MSSGPRAACVLLWRPDGRILAVTRSIWRPWGPAGIPGGKCLPRESLYVCAARELKEETGAFVFGGPEALEAVWRDTCRGPRAFDVTTFVVRPAYRPAARLTARRALTHEGWVRWLPRARLESGPFGEYNRGLFAEMDRRGWR